MQWIIARLVILIHYSADFGVSILLEDLNENGATKGTYHFMSPELLSKDTRNCVPADSDIWALGVTFFCFIFLELPFFDSSLVGLFKKIQKNMKLKSAQNS